MGASLKSLSGLVKSDAQGSADEIILLSRSLSFVLENSVFLTFNSSGFNSPKYFFGYLNIHVERVAESLKSIWSSFRDDHLSLI